jgi:hypothetical protein
MIRKCLYLIILVITVVIIELPSLAQTKYYIYSYDYSGNRIRKERDLTKSAKIKVGINTDKSETNKEGTIKDNKITIYPNPTNGLLNVCIPDLGDENAFLSIFNSNGKMIYKKIVNSTLSQINLDKQPSGIYLIKISVRGNSLEWKIIKD